MIPKAVLHLTTAAEKQRMRYVLRNWGWELKETWHSLMIYDFDNEWMFDVTLMKNRGRTGSGGSSQAVREKGNWRNTRDSGRRIGRKNRSLTNLWRSCSRKSMKSIMGQR